MSLVNKMLRDLDQRQATAVERAGLAAHVRALPAERGVPWSRVLPMLAGTVMGAAGIWLFVESRQMPPAETPIVARGAAPELAGPAPLAIPMPALTVPMPKDSVASADLGQNMEPPAAGPVQRAQSAPSAQATAFAASFRIDTRLSPSQRIRTEPVAEAPQQAIEKRQATQAPDAAEGAYRRAMAVYREGRTAEAYAGFEAALRADARHVAARQAMLSLLMEQRRWPEAQALAADGLGLDATQAGWAMILARLQVEQGQIAEAEQTMARHGTHGERSPDYLAFHALLLQKLQRPREAAERYLAASALRPAEGRWWYGLGVVLDADQRPQEAREAFRKAKESGNLPPELLAAVDRRLRQ